MFRNLTLLKLGAAIQVTSSNQDRPIRKVSTYIYTLSCPSQFFFYFVTTKGGKEEVPGERAIP